MKRIKTLIIAHGRHGKDTVAKYLYKHFGVTNISSSKMAMDLFIYDKLKDKYGYTNKDECYNNRLNKRVEWYNMIREYNTPNKSRLAEVILDKYDCYVGMRDYDEFMVCYSKSLFDLIIWVDASERLPNEDSESFNIDKSYSDIIIDNNGTEEILEQKVIKIGGLIWGSEK